MSPISHNNFSNRHKLTCVLGAAFAILPISVSAQQPVRDHEAYYGLRLKLEV